MKKNTIKKQISKFTYLALVGSIAGSITYISCKGLEQLNFSQIPEYTTEDLRNMIYESPSLSIEEKTYLFNSDFFKDVLSTVNNSKESLYEYQKKFKDIKIVSFEKTDDKEGYYARCTEPNVLYISDYEKLSSLKKDTVSHEFVHLCQNSYCTLNFLIEATAEIISEEYFELSRINAYIYEVEVTKVLMEIIGPEPIWNYVFTNNISEIEKEINPFFTKEEKNEFIKCLTFNPDNKEKRKENLEKLNELLNILYEKKYQSNIDDDLIISLIRNHEPTLKRYYFNQRYIKEEYSFYRKENTEKKESLTFEEADIEGLMFFLCFNDIISYKEYMEKKNQEDVFYINIDGTVKEDKLEVILPEKTYLPTINERKKAKIKTQ